MQEKYLIIKNVPLLRFVSTMALSKVNVDSRTKRLVLLIVPETTSSSSMSTNASASLPQVNIRHSRHLNVRIKAKSVAINCDIISNVNIPLSQCIYMVAVHAKPHDKIFKNHLFAEAHSRRIIRLV